METKTEEWVTVPLVYTGRRAGEKGMLLHCFLSPEGEQLGYRKSPTFATIGSTYDVEVNGGSARISSAVVTDAPRDARRAEWALEDAAAYKAKLAQDALKRQMAASRDFGSLTLDEINSLMVGMTAISKAAVMTAVLSKLQVKW